MIRQARPRSATYIAIVFLLLGVVQLAGSLAFYQIIDRQTLRDDHARRVAELLVVSDRVYAIAPDRTARSMTTGHLVARVAQAPLVTAAPRDEGLRDIERRIVAWEPSLTGRSLRLATTDEKGGQRDLIGSIRLADGNWLNFLSRDISTMWPVAWRAMALTFVIAIACLGLGLVALNRLGRPLRRLTDAAEAIGRGREVAIAEHGPKDMRDLAHAMNVMQQRIARILQDQARAFEAISHDMRTPLSRQKAIAGMVGDPELAGILHDSVGEMDDLLTSLQDFLQAQHITAGPETLELGALLRPLLGCYADRVTFHAEGDALVETFREPLIIATLALVENAVQYGDRAHVRVERIDGLWTIAVQDEGPGIPASFFQDVLEPFFRLDEARQRNTKGFGLGIPTAHRLMERFNGRLSFAAASEGGLIARLEVPRA